MEIDFDFELNTDSDQNNMGVNCLNESWFLYLRDTDHKIATKSTPLCKKDDEQYSDLNIFGTIPILESFSALSCIIRSTATKHNSTSSSSSSSSSSTINDVNCYNNVISCLEIPSYNGSGTSSPSKSSRKRPLINYSESEHDSAFSSHSPSTASSSSYNQDLDTTITDIIIPTPNSSSSEKSTSSSSTSSKKRFHSSSASPTSSSSSTSSSKRCNSSSTTNSSQQQVVERKTAIVNPRLSRSQTRETINLPQIENKQPTCDNLTVSEPVEQPTACRTRTELIALKASTPTVEILQDDVPTVVETLLETAGSPTKPTDEPALPDDDNDVKPFLENTQIEQVPIITPSSTSQSTSLINISVDELSIDKLKLKHPALFTHPEDMEPAKKFVKYDPFITETNIICDEDSLQPKQKIVKFKYSPFESRSTETSNLYIMKLEETIDTPQPLPCGIYEIESTKPFYRIKPDPGIYETNDLDDENDWKLTKLSTFDFDIKQEETAPPTPQTPECMKCVQTDEEFTFVNMFSGLYDIESAALVTPDETHSVCNLPQLNGIQFRQLVTKPHARSKVGNTITPNLLQDFQMNSTLKQCLNNLNHLNRSRTVNNNNNSQLRNSSQLRP